MPAKKTIAKAKQHLKEGKRPTTAASEFVREEMEHIRRGKHGARSTKQAIAIGLSKARRAGIPLEPPKKGQAKERTRRAAERAYEVGQGEKKPRKPSRKRSQATSRALKREPRAAASRKALSQQAKSAAKRRARAKAATKKRAHHDRDEPAPRPRRTSPGPGTPDDSTDTRYWSQRVTETSNALDLEQGVFGKPTARQTAHSLKRSAEQSRRRKSEPFRSAMSMLNFYINRAGKKLSPERRRVLDATKDELRKAFHR